MRQELGLDEVISLDDDLRQDPAFKRLTLEQRQAVDVNLGRDGCRVPLPWARSGSSMGFGSDGGSSPWLPQPQRWSRLSVSAQEDSDDSMLAVVRRAIAVRRSCTPLLEGAFSWGDEVALASSAAAADSAVPSIVAPLGLTAAGVISRAFAGAAADVWGGLRDFVSPRADPNVLVIERSHATAGRVVCVFNMVRFRMTRAVCAPVSF
jgi:hypothetical protein